MEENPEGTPVLDSPPEKTVFLSPLPSQEISRQTLLRQQAARLRKGKSLSPKLLGRKLRKSSSRARPSLASIPEARALRQKLSFGSMEMESSSGKLDGRSKRKGNSKGKRSAGDVVEDDALRRQKLLLEQEETFATTEGCGSDAEETLHPTQPGSENENFDEVQDTQVHDLEASEEVSNFEGPKGLQLERSLVALPDGGSQNLDIDAEMVTVGETQMPGGTTETRPEKWPMHNPRSDGNDGISGVLAPPDGEMLDILAAQPLQSRGEVFLPDSPQGRDEEMSHALEDNNLHWTTDQLLANAPAENESASDFPPLSKGRTKLIRANFEGAGNSLIHGGKNLDSHSAYHEVGQNLGDVVVRPPGSSNHGSSKTGVQPTNPWVGNGVLKPTAAQRLAGSSAGQHSKEAVPFEPGKIREIGYSSTSNGIPSIYFSKPDNDYLAERLGHAIVGKFSHSIPASHQIQRTLDGIRFIGSFSWKFINAKHIIIQFQKIADYATLLNGPNGMPVWLVDRHPMRVFKWTTEFDPFFETPIAAVWCNLIGLPIHLYDTSALFAIGRLLGTPIQVDHATNNQSRLSFARICIEIDISKEPTEEIIIDILGREVRQKVKWDRIPTYCTECRHVGHSSATCYAYGKRAPPGKRDYHKPHNGQNHQGGPRDRPTWVSGKQTSNRAHAHEKEQTHKVNKNVSKATVTSNSFQVLTRDETTIGEMGNKDGGKSDWAAKGSAMVLRRESEDEEGFQVVRSRKDRNRMHTVLDLHDHVPTTFRTAEADKGESSKQHSRSLSPPGLRGKSRADDEGALTFLESSKLAGDKPKFYKMLDNGEFDTEEFDEEIEMEEEDPGGTPHENSLERERPLIQGADSHPELENNTPKKARLSTSDVSELSQ